MLIPLVCPRDQIRVTGLAISRHYRVVLNFCRFYFLRFFHDSQKSSRKKRNSHKNLLRKSLLHWLDYTYKQHNWNHVAAIYLKNVAFVQKQNDEMRNKTFRNNKKVNRIGSSKGSPLRRASTIPPSW